MYGNFEVRSSFLVWQRIDHLNAHKATHPLAADTDIVGSFHVVKPLVLRKLGADTVSRHGLLCVIVAPTGMYEHLSEKLENDHSLTLREREFMEEYEALLQTMGKDAVIRRENKTKPRKKKAALDDAKDG